MSPHCVYVMYPAWDSVHYDWHLISWQTPPHTHTESHAHTVAQFENIGTKSDGNVRTAMRATFRAQGQRMRISKYVFLGQTTTTLSAPGRPDSDPCMPTESSDYNLSGDGFFLTLI